MVSRDEAIELAQEVAGSAAVAEREVAERSSSSTCSRTSRMDEEISLFKNDDFWDLCAGPHVGRGPATARRSS